MNVEAAKSPITFNHPLPKAQKRECQRKKNQGMKKEGEKGK